MEEFLREEREEKERKRQASKRRRVNFELRRKLSQLSGGIHVDRGNYKTIHATVDIETYMGLNKVVDKEDYLAMEKQIWSTAMDYWKAKDICSDYDLIPDNITMNHMVFESHTWFHCNLLGQRRDSTNPSRTSVFVELKIKRNAEYKNGISYVVMACIALDENSSCTCRVCPASKGVLHPSKGGFICGSEDGQKVFCYTIPVNIRFSEPCNEKATM